MKTQLHATPARPGAALLASVLITLLCGVPLGHAEPTRATSDNALTRPVAAAAPAPSSRKRDSAPTWREQWSEQPQWGGRIAYVDGNGDLNVARRSAAAPAWVTLAHEVRDFQIQDWRIAVRKRDGSLWLGEEALNNPLVQVADAVAAYQLTQTRLGILKTDGSFSIKDGPAAPQEAAKGVASFQLTELRAALLGGDGSLWLNQGGGVEAFEKLAEDVDAFQIEREWVAFRRDGRLLLGKLGTWDLGFQTSDLKFTEIARHAVDFEMEIFVEFSALFPSRLHLAVLDAGGRVHYGEGATADFELKAIATPTAKRSAWSNGRLALHGTDGHLRIAALDDDMRLGSFRDLGELKAFRLGAEGTALAYRAAAKSSGKLRLFEAVPKAQASGGGNEQAPRGEGSNEFDPALSKALIADSVTLDGDIVLGLSSLRPDYTRRPVAGATPGKAALQLLGTSALRAADVKPLAAGSDKAIGDGLCPRDLIVPLSDGMVLPIPRPQCTIALSAEPTPYWLGYATNYQYAAGTWIDGQFFPDMVSGGTTWHAYKAGVDPGSISSSGWVYPPNGQNSIVTHLLGSNGTNNQLFFYRPNYSTKSLTFSGITLAPTSGSSASYLRDVTTSGKLINFWISSSTQPIPANFSSSNPPIVGNVIDAGWQGPPLVSCASSGNPYFGSNPYYLSDVTSSNNTITFSRRGCGNAVQNALVNTKTVTIGQSCWDVGYWKSQNCSSTYCGQPLCGAGVGGRAYYPVAGRGVPPAGSLVYAGVLDPAGYGMLPSDPAIDSLFVRDGQSNRPPILWLGGVANSVQTANSYVTNVGGASDAAQSCAASPNSTGPGNVASADKAASRKVTGATCGANGTPNSDSRATATYRSPQGRFVIDVMVATATSPWHFRVYATGINTGTCKTCTYFDAIKTSAALVNPITVPDSEVQWAAATLTSLPGYSASRTIGIGHSLGTLGITWLVRYGYINTQKSLAPPFNIPVAAMATNGKVNQYFQIGFDDPIAMNFFIPGLGVYRTDQLNNGQVQYRLDETGHYKFSDKFAPHNKSRVGNDGYPQDIFMNSLDGFTPFDFTLSIY